jgi:hypothetical protein
MFLGAMFCRRAGTARTRYPVLVHRHLKDAASDGWRETPDGDRHHATARRGVQFFKDWNDPQFRA